MSQTELPFSLAKQTPPDYISWYYEDLALKQGYVQIGGADEAGRGPLFGPVVAAIVILPRENEIKGLNDSKLLTPEIRENLFAEIKEKAIAAEFGVSPPETIDRVNILQATFLAVKEAYEKLHVKLDYLITDYLKPKDFPCHLLPLTKGDRKSYSVAAASIIAKVTRDRMLLEYDREFPGYDLALNKGYPTRKHLEALKKLGPTALHRKTFKGVKELIEP